MTHGLVRFGALVLLLLGLLPDLASAAGPSPDASAPVEPVRLVFIHHSTGDVWLENGLRTTLNANNYFVVDTNYGWGQGYPTPGSTDSTIGDHTDLGNWWDWFNGPYRDTYLADLYPNSQSAAGNSGVVDPGGPNTIVMFKSCFPNSNLGGSPTDPPPAVGAANPLRGQDAGSEAMTVGNAKGIYRDLLAYFSAHQEHLFVAITPPPLVSGDTSSDAAANARAFDNWLVTDWLADYPYANVAVFDFYNVLTSNGGSVNTNDLGSASGNHHRYRNGAIEHQVATSQNTSAYAQAHDNSHPTGAGAQKAAAEYVPLLNIAYHRWLGQAAGTPIVTKSAATGPFQQGDAVPFRVTIRWPAARPDTVTMTDVLPAGLAYLNGTLSATGGAVNPAGAPTLTWTGVLSPTPAVTITYAAQVTLSGPAALPNTAQVSVPGVDPTLATATILANPISAYLPIMARDQ